MLAVGVSRGWRQTLQKTSAAVAALVVLVSVFGVSLASRVPLHVLQFVVGLALLLFGLAWLREAAAFDRLVGRLASERRPGRRFDDVAFVAAFKGVFLEDLGVEWPGSELAVLYIAAAYSMASLVAFRLLARPAGEPQRSVPKRSLGRSLEPGGRSGRRAGVGGPPAAGKDGLGEDA